MTHTNSRGPALGFFLAALTALGLMLAAGEPAHAAKTFTVDSTGDGADVTVADGECDALPLAAKVCTLRAAIQQANATPGTDTINFNIPGGGVRTISPASALPLITDAVTVDGYSQPGSQVNTKPVGTDAKLLVEIDGTNAGSTGMIIRANNVRVRGLVVNDFRFGGISVNNGFSNARIEGNFVGTDASGTVDRGNGGNGVSMVFGGTDNTVGGLARTARNLISGNGASGVEIQQSSGNNVLGNLVGTKSDGLSALGNGSSGVAVLEAADNTIGGAAIGASNTVAFNGEDGVEVDQSNPSADVTGNSVRVNSTFSNGGLGIDLEGGTENAAGATANDPKDADQGPNDLQNKPFIASAVTTGGKTTIKGNLKSTARDPFVVEFFSNPSGNEGTRFVGDAAVSTNASGNASGNVSFTFTPSQAIPAGQTVTATATNAVSGDTSELSAPRAVAAR